MPNDFYKPEQVAAVAVQMIVQDSYLSALISRNFENDLLAGGGKGRTVNLKVPGALIARTRDIEDVTSQIVLDAIAEKTVPVELGTHVYNAVALSEGDVSLNIADFSAQVLRPQIEAVVEEIEATVADKLLSTPIEAAVEFDPANPVQSLTKVRTLLRKRGVPQTGLQVVVGTDVYAAFLDADAISNVGQSGSTAALREANVGTVRGFTIVESTRVPDDEIVAFHRDAFTLAVRAPKVPEGASFGAAQSGAGFSLRYLRDYDVMHTVDRSMVSTFAGVADMPLFKVVRDRNAKTADVEEVAYGAALHIGTKA